MNRRLIPKVNRRLLREYRVGRGWTVNEAARAIGISPQALHFLERGVNQPRAGTLQRIAEVYGLVAEDFFKASPRVSHAEGR